MLNEWKESKDPKELNESNALSQTSQIKRVEPVNKDVEPRGNVLITGVLRSKSCYPSGTNKFFQL